MESVKYSIGVDVVTLKMKIILKQSGNVEKHVYLIIHRPITIFNSNYLNEFWSPKFKDEELKIKFNTFLHSGS